MVAALGQVVVALAKEKGADVSVALLGKLPGGGERRSARDRAEPRERAAKVAVWLGNLAAQHARASELQMLAQEIARLTDGSFGFIGEAANSVGGYLAGAVPGEGGPERRRDDRAGAQGLRDPEPRALSSTTPIRRRRWRPLDGAQLVVALTSFDSPSLRQVADVMLPIAPSPRLPEPSSTAKAGRRASRRWPSPSPTFVRAGRCCVLGNLLALEGFAQADSEAVRAEALAGDLASRLDNGVEGIVVSSATGAAGALERVADVPIHFADLIARRAPSLQKTRDAAAPTARMAPATLAALGLAAGRPGACGAGRASVELVAQADEGLAAGCVRVAAAHPRPRRSAR